MSALQTATPHRLELKAVMDGGLSEEQELHKQFHASRVAGEWFALSSELKQFIANTADAPPSRPRREKQMVKIDKLDTWADKQGGREKASALLDISMATLSRIIAGKQKPGWELVARINTASGGKISANDFMDKA